MTECPVAAGVAPKTRCSRDDVGLLSAGGPKCRTMTECPSAAGVAPKTRCSRDDIGLLSARGPKCRMMTECPPVAGVAPRMATGLPDPDDREGLGRMDPRPPLNVWLVTGRWKPRDLTVMAYVPIRAPWKKTGGASKSLDFYFFKSITRTRQICNTFHILVVRFVQIKNGTNTCIKLELRMQLVNIRKF